MKSGNFEHLGTKRDTKIGLKYKKRITMDKMKRETRRNSKEELCYYLERLEVFITKDITHTF